MAMGEPRMEDVRVESRGGETGNRETVGQREGREWGKREIGDRGD